LLSRRIKVSCRRKWRYQTELLLKPRLSLSLSLSLYFPLTTSKARQFTRLKAELNQPGRLGWQSGWLAGRQAGRRLAGGDEALADLSRRRKTIRMGFVRPKRHS
jgi:hypothetical protein